MKAPARATALARIRLRHLQCLLAVAEAGHLKGAAEALAISQPAVTKTLNELEAMLGVRLFERSRRGALPTPEAQLFLRHAQDSVDALGQAVDSVLRGRAERPLRLGVLPTVAPSVVPRALLAWRQERPAAELRVVTGLNGALLAALRARELDVVVGRLAEPDEMLGLSFELLYAEPLVIVARPGHPMLAPGATVLQLGRHPLVLPLAGTVIRHSADSWMARHGVTPQAGWVETVSGSLARALVLGSDTLWIGPLSAVEPELASGALQRLALPTTGTEEPVGLLLRADAPPPAGALALAAALRDEAARRRVSG